MQGIIHPWRPRGGLSDREKWRQEKARESVLENFGHRFSDSTNRPWVSEGKFCTWQCRTYSKALDNAIIVQ